MTETVYCVAMVFLAVFCFCTGYMIGDQNRKNADRIESIEKWLKEGEQSDSRRDH